MVESRKTKPSAPPIVHSEPAEDIELLVARLVAFLNWKSQRPIEDAKRIKGVVDEILSEHRRAGRSQRSATHQLTDLFKDEPMPRSKTVSSATAPLKRQPSPEFRELLTAVVDNPEAWLSTPSVQFGGRRPGDLIGSDEEEKIVDLLRAVEQGLF